MKPLDQDKHALLLESVHNMKQRPSGLIVMDPDPSRAYTNSTWSNAAQPEVTIDSITKAIEEFNTMMPLPPMPRFVVIKFPPPTVTVQARTHRRSRINKKWRKKYGFITIPDTKVINSVYVDKERNIAYVFPEQMERIRKAIAEYKERIDSDLPGGLL